MCAYSQRLSYQICPLKKITKTNLNIHRSLIITYCWFSILTLCRQVFLPFWRVCFLFIYLSCYVNSFWQCSLICHKLCLDVVLEIGQDEAVYVSYSWSHQGQGRFRRISMLQEKWWHITNINNLILCLSASVDSRARRLIGRDRDGCCRMVNITALHEHLFITLKLWHYQLWKLTGNLCHNATQAGENKETLYIWCFCDYPGN